MLKVWSKKINVYLYRKDLAIRGASWLIEVTDKLEHHPTATNHLATTHSSLGERSPTTCSSSLDFATKSSLSSRSLLLMSLAKHWNATRLACTIVTSQATRTSSDWQH